MAELSAFEKAQSLKILGCYNHDIEKSIEKQDLEKGGIGSGRKYTGNKKPMVGDHVQVHPQLTTDPKNRQGQYGKIYHVDRENSEAHVSFDDGGSGVYSHDGLLRKTKPFEKSEDTNLEKGGEGSHGGKVIGHTASGHPIYDSYNHPAHKNFSSFEHHEAAIAHSNQPNDTGIEGNKHMNHVALKADSQHAGFHPSNIQNHDLDHHRELQHGDEITRTPVASSDRKWGVKGKPIIHGKNPEDYHDFTAKNHHQAALIHDNIGNHELAQKHLDLANEKKPKYTLEKSDTEDEGDAGDNMSDDDAQ